MIDKQIIDGVDVSGCSYGEIKEGIFKCSCEYNVRSASMFCKDNPNCYYKQLKRKEQKNEELKQTLAEIKFWARELLKRTGQVVPYEIKQILQKINECEVENERKENCN